MTLSMKTVIHVILSLALTCTVAGLHVKKDLVSSSTTRPDHEQHDLPLVTPWSGPLPDQQAYSTASLGTEGFADAANDNDQRTGSCIATICLSKPAPSDPETLHLDRAGRNDKVGLARHTRPAESLKDLQNDQYASPIDAITMERGSQATRENANGKIDGRRPVASLRKRGNPFKKAKGKLGNVGGTLQSAAAAAATHGKAAMAGAGTLAAGQLSNIQGGLGSAANAASNQLSNVVKGGLNNAANLGSNQLSNVVKGGLGTAADLASNQLSSVVKGGLNSAANLASGPFSDAVKGGVNNAGKGIGSASSNIASLGQSAANEVIDGAGRVMNEQIKPAVAKAKQKAKAKTLQRLPEAAVGAESSAQGGLDNADGAVQDAIVNIDQRVQRTQSEPSRPGLKHKGLRHAGQLLSQLPKVAMQPLVGGAMGAVARAQVGISRAATLGLQRVNSATESLTNGDINPLSWNSKSWNVLPLVPLRSGWNLAAMWQREKITGPTNGAKKFNRSYRYVAGAGSGTDVYVVSTGVSLRSPDFKNDQVTRMPEAVTHTSGQYMSVINGTRVAALVAAKTFGVAPSASIIDVPVLAPYVGDPSVTYTRLTNIIYDIIAKHDEKKQKARWQGAASSWKGSVMLICLQASAMHPKVAAALRAAYHAGIFIVAPAGDQARRIDADDAPVWPCVMYEVLCVGGYDKNYAIDGSSNFGPAVNIYAPGYRVTTSGVNLPLGLRFKVTGTDFAAAQVAGVAAIFIAFEGLYDQSDEVRDRVEANAWEATTPYGTSIKIASTGLAAALKSQNSEFYGYPYVTSYKFGRITTGYSPLDSECEARDESTPLDEVADPAESSRDEETQAAEENFERKHGYSDMIAPPLSRNPLSFMTDGHTRPIPDRDDPGTSGRFGGGSVDYWPEDPVEAAGAEDIPDGSCFVKGEDGLFVEYPNRKGKGRAQISAQLDKGSTMDDSAGRRTICRSNIAPPAVSTVPKPRRRNFRRQLASTSSPSASSLPTATTAPSSLPVAPPPDANKTSCAAMGPSSAGPPPVHYCQSATSSISKVQADAATAVLSALGNYGEKVCVYAADEGEADVIPCKEGACATWLPGQLISVNSPIYATVDYVYIRRALELLVLHCNETGWVGGFVTLPRMGDSVALTFRPATFV